jgi:hypothetical protein
MSKDAEHKAAAQALEAFKAKGGNVQTCETKRARGVVKRQPQGAWKG